MYQRKKIKSMAVVLHHCYSFITSNESLIIWANLLSFIVFSVSDPHSFHTDPDPDQNLCADPYRYSIGTLASLLQSSGDIKYEYIDFSLSLEYIGRLHAFIFEKTWENTCVKN